MGKMKETLPEYDYEYGDEPELEAGC